MQPDSFTHFFKGFFHKAPVFSTLLTLTSLSGLMSCDTDPKVDPSFGYAFMGTGAVMVIALVIATVVTRRSDKKKREGER